MTSFQNFSGASVEYRVLLYAVNSIGTSEVVEYPTTIGMSELHVPYMLDQRPLSNSI